MLNLLNKSKSLFRRFWGYYNVVMVCLTFFKMKTEKLHLIDSVA